MKRKLFVAVIILMTISLVGIIIVQLLWIKNAIEVKEEQFDRSVNEALTNVVDKIHQDDAVRFIAQSSDSSSNYVEYDYDSFTFFNQSVRDSLISDYVLITVNGDTNIEFIEDIRVNQPVLLSRNEEFDLIVKSGQSNSITHISSKPGENGYNSIATPVYIGKDKVKYRIKRIDNALKKLTYEYVLNDIPIYKRFDLNKLKGIILMEVSNKDLPQNFEYALKKNEEEILVNSDNYTPTDTLNNYKINIDPKNFYGSKNATLSITFPGKSSHLFREITLLLAGSSLFTLIIILTFVITIRIILKQKKISEVKSDFINNMTHEFKTPIATISLAADSIANPKILEDKKEVLYYTNIIKEENKRMDSQVENVLQMSLLDKNELNLDMGVYNVHDLIVNAIKNISLQVEKANGKVETKLLAKFPYSKVDKIHFTNVLYNLMDNALKYSDNEPVISIETTNLNSNISILVADQGIGMTKETQRKIFEKFHRVETGNIHNIRGFGLGLSYVKAIITACDGSINVKSEIQKGSSFTITLPIENNE